MLKKQESISLMLKIIRIGLMPHIYPGCLMIRLILNFLTDICIFCQL